MVSRDERTRSRPGGRAAVAQAAAPLDLHEGIVTPRRPGCERWPENLRLRSDGGEFVRGRCKATNLCDYCARLAAVETSEMLLLDALEYAPTVYAVLTARELLTRQECRRHLDKLRASLRRQWPGIEWAVLVEFQRRGALHLNLLVKGVDESACARLWEAICRVWCARVDAEPVAQFVGPVYDGGGVVRYISQHFLKPSQAPPRGWRGHRFSCTRGYLVRPASEMRLEARRSLSLKRALHRGVPADLLELELAVAAGKTWELVEVRRAPYASVVEPLRAFA